MNTMWLDESKMFVHNRDRDPTEKPAIVGCRRVVHSDLPRIGQLVRTKTYDMFGDVNLGCIHEISCLSLGQVNQKDELVSSISLCTYPNVPSIPSYDWFSWMVIHYGMGRFTERETLFIHLLVWDTRYNDEFFMALLDAVFISTTFCNQVILVMPPWVGPVDLIEKHMTRIVPKGLQDGHRIQALYVSFRHSHCPKLKIRRVVEEDNDDIVPIIDRDSHRIKDMYGEYYISEMMRYPDGMRQLVVAEVDGLATGVLCLNRIIDIDMLNEYFELGPYRGLRKPHESDVIVMPDTVKTVSQILFRKESQELPEDGSVLEEVEKISSVEHNAPPSIMRAQNGFKKTGGFNDMPKRVSINPLVSPDATNIDDYYNRNNRDTSEESQDSVSIKSADTDSSTRDDDDDDESHQSNHQMYSGDFKTKLRENVFAATIADDPRTSWTIKAEKSESKASESCERAISKGGASKYYGEPNAFAMELFSMTPKIGERRAVDYLGAAFECFPDRDFCAMLIPSTYHLFAFLEHFVRVPLRFNKDFPMVLYLAHRSTFLGNLKSRETIPFDRNDILEFLHGMPKKEAVLRDFDDVMLSRHQKESYIFLWEGSIVGLAILCIEDDVDYLRSRYMVEDYVSIPNVPTHAHARLLHWVLMPIFSIYHRFFFREIMRLSSTSVIYYRLYENEVSSLTRTHPLISCLNVMIPVNPRKQIDYTYGHYKDNMPSDVILSEKEQKFSLFLMSAQMSMVPKSDVNAKFVIVGASDCGLAVAEYLAMWSDSSFMHFTNVTLVSANGIPFEQERNFFEYKMLPFRGRYCYEYRNHITARAWLNIVYGKMVSIDRKDKYITIADMGTLSYDYLILTGGLQYQKPKFSEEIDAEKRGELKDFEIPSNCLTINDDKEASICFERLKQLINDDAEKYIVLYGHNVDCYCVLNVLLEYGIKASKITLIEPLSQICKDHKAAFLYDEEVDAAVTDALKKSGTNVLAGWEIIDWEVEEVGKEKLIRYLNIETKTETRKIPCDMLLNFNEKTICMNTFKAIAKAGLVFDGLLVIDPEYRTNDPFIFAAGTITKYSRKLGTKGWCHKYYNRVEVGETLAKVLKNLVDSSRPANANEEKRESKDARSLPIFRHPIIIACTLPGGYHYLHVEKSGRKIPRVVAMRQESYGDVLITGHPSSDIGYFRMRLNQFNTVKSITCLSKKPFEIHNIISLYGKHNAMLNDVKLRYQNSLVPDLYSYFREPWATALFLDRFQGLRDQNRATLLSFTTEVVGRQGRRKIPSLNSFLNAGVKGIYGNSLIDDCLRALIKSKWEAISNEDRKMIKLKFNSSPYQEKLKSDLIEFLQYYENQLPMYCNPRKLRYLLSDIEDSPLFYNQ